MDEEKNEEIIENTAEEESKEEIVPEKIEAKEVKVEDRPEPRPGPEPKPEEPKKDKKGFCIAALVLGIAALIFFCIWYISIPCGILAIIFGILGIKSKTKGMAIAGLITGSIGLVISTVILIFLFMIGFIMGISGAMEDSDFDIDSFRRNIIRDYDLYD